MYDLYSNIVGIIILIISTIIFYELIYIAWHGTSKIFKKASHAKVIIVVLFTFVGHFITITIYALAYYFSDYITAPQSYILFTFEPHTTKTLADYIYFSAITYSSLGYGEVIPIGHLRYLAMAEALNGLVLIAWTASLSYLAMQESWEQKKVRRKNRKTQKPKGLFSRKQKRRR